jgi:hypothetical protein
MEWPVLDNAGGEGFFDGFLNDFGGMVDGAGMDGIDFGGDIEGVGGWGDGINFDGIGDGGIDIGVMD